MIKITQTAPEASFTSCVVITSLSELPLLVSSDELVQKAKEKFDLGASQLYDALKEELVFSALKAESEEDFRVLGAQIWEHLNTLRVANVRFKLGQTPNHLKGALLEGFCLASYQFTKYISQPEKSQKNTLKEACVSEKEFSKSDLHQLEAGLTGVKIARDLVNEPASFLNATTYSQLMEAYGERFGFSVEVLEKSKLTALKMGGILAVNQGSAIPPTFNILSYRHPKARDKQPTVLVGKGIVYDTGGLSLKTTAGSMDIMKCDMAGSAAIVGAMCTIAKLALPLNVVALVPVTDNRLSANAYAPGDVIRMHNGLYVEVKNTDAEGRLVLADAMSYAERFEPKELIEMSTLTGSAVAAIGSEGAVMMGNNAESMHQLQACGERVHERLVEFPFWDDYDEHLRKLGKT